LVATDPEDLDLHHRGTRLTGASRYSHRICEEPLNRALHMAVVTRMRMDPATRAYVERRTAEGRTLREIRRCLKRYLARQIYRHLNSAAATEERQPSTT